MMRRPPSRGVQTTTTIRLFNKPSVKKQFSPCRSEGTVKSGAGKRLLGGAICKPQFSSVAWRFTGSKVIFTDKCYYRKERGANFL